MQIRVRSKLVLIANAFIFLVILCITTLVIVIYLDFVRAGADANSVGELFVSLVPTVILSGITWSAKQMFFKEFEEDMPAGLDEEEEVSLIKIGRFSVGSKHRKSFRKTQEEIKETEKVPGNSVENAENFVININLPNQSDTDTPKPKTQEPGAQESGTQEPESESTLQFTNKLALEKLKGWFVTQCVLFLTDFMQIFASVVYMSYFNIIIYAHPQKFEPAHV